MKIVSQKKITLKSHPEINERVIQDYIYNDPSVLGLGELQSVMKEKTQPLGGRLDLLLSDGEKNRYEVELQLGATDPSHIIRTIEYWDTERKRYPQYNHTAVIIAEDVTSRFQNVISLFNNQIPLIALQINAVETSDGNVAISFVKVMDKVEPGQDEEEFVESVNRSYWEKRVGKEILNLSDRIFEKLEIAKLGYEQKYNKFYIGLQKDGLARNFVYVKPKKSFVHLIIRSSEFNEMTEKLSNVLDIDYDRNWPSYRIKVKHIEDLDSNLQDILYLVESAKEKYGLE